MVQDRWAVVPVAVKAAAEARARAAEDAARAVEDAARAAEGAARAVEARVEAEAERADKEWEREEAVNVPIVVKPLPINKAFPVMQLFARIAIFRWYAKDKT